MKTAMEACCRTEMYMYLGVTKSMFALLCVSTVLFVVPLQMLMLLVLSLHVRALWLLEGSSASKIGVWVFFGLDS